VNGLCKATDSTKLAERASERRITLCYSGALPYIVYRFTPPREALRGHGMKLSEFNFGEYDARREFLRDEDYFIQTFIDPISFPLGTLSNRTNYIIVGQKGAGKTACQLYLETNKAKKQGYLSGLISFYEDLTPDDYKDFASTQRINLISLDQLTSMKEASEISVSEFNKIAEQLLVADCRQYRLYFFVDELVISNLNTKSDEFKARLCLIRDIVRSCCQLNDFCVKHDLDMHFICNLRPEIRTRLNELDAEISKIMDGNDVFLSWDRDSLLEILTQKIVFGAPESAEIDASVFLPNTISFGNHTSDFITFLLNNSWYKPRDIVRFLKAYAKVNPNHTSITEAGAKDCLNEYARISAIELFEQISVYYSTDVLEGIRTGIRRRRYDNAASLENALKPHIDVNPRRLVEQLYTVGVIGNVDSVGGKPRYFWSYRQEEHLDCEMEITVHPGLINYFNVRHR
jgi:hypothetical protein